MVTLPLFCDCISPFWYISLWTKGEKKPKPNVETTIHVPDILDVNRFVMNEWDFGFCTVSRRIRASSAGTKVKQSLDDQRADVIDIATTDQYLVLLLPSSQGIVFLLCSAKMDHVTVSDRRNRTRSNNRHFLAEAVKSPCEIICLFSSLPQRPEKGVSVHLGPCAVGGPPQTMSDMPCEQRNIPLCHKPWDLGD